MRLWKALSEIFEPATPLRNDSFRSYRGDRVSTRGRMRQTIRRLGRRDWPGENRSAASITFAERFSEKNHHNERRRSKTEIREKEPGTSLSTDVFVPLPLVIYPGQHTPSGSGTVLAMWKPPLNFLTLHCQQLTRVDTM